MWPPPARRGCFFFLYKYYMHLQKFTTTSPQPSAHTPHTTLHTPPRTHTPEEESALFCALLRTNDAMAGVQLRRRNGGGGPHRGGVATRLELVFLLSFFSSSLPARTTTQGGGGLVAFAVGLCKLKAVDPYLERQLFSPIHTYMVSKFAFNC